MRINSLKGSNQDILSKIEEEGYTRKKYDDICNCDCLTQSQKNEGSKFSLIVVTPLSLLPLLLFLGNEGKVGME